MIDTSKPSAIDLFCGCGGISVGLERAGFRVLAGIDIEKKYIASFQHNFPNAKAMTTDITTVLPEDFMHMVGVRPENLTCLWAGLPAKGSQKMFRGVIATLRTRKTFWSNHSLTIAKFCSQKWS